ncbi:hypothetical protein A2686_03165 [Candidatus Woesebacteria bacterium RIFCSPHIGHO2_01_FULL_38_10]|nr:MAG: hypothetical protein A2686_03165 [Candidatus Woesebacteria bacterium RIFCSPHIGHO2_01_FULL_38_10]
MLKRLKLPDFLFKYVIVAILITIPLYPKFPFIRVPGTFVSIRLEDLLLAFGAILVFITFTDSTKRSSFFKNAVNKAILLFWAVGFVSLLSGIFLTKTLDTHIAVLHWLRRIEYMIPFYLGIETVVRVPKGFDFYLKVLLMVIILLFIYGLGQRYLTFPIIITQNEEYSKGIALRWVQGSHINSTFAGHYDLASFLVLVLPIIISSLFIFKGMLTRLILSFASFAGLWLLVYSASRISFVTYLISSCFSLIIMKKFKEMALVFLISLAFIGFSSNLLARYQRLIEVSFGTVKKMKMINFIDPGKVYAEGVFNKKEKPVPTPTENPVFEDRSTSIRLNVEWPRAISSLRKNPFLGTGYSSIGLATDNDYLRLLGEVGILGFSAFLLIFFRIGKLFLRVLPDIPRLEGANLAFVSGLIGAIPGLFINAIFIDIFEASKFAIIFWLIVGLTVGYLLNRYVQEN